MIRSHADDVLAAYVNKMSPLLPHYHRFVRVIKTNREKNANFPVKFEARDK